MPDLTISAAAARSGLPESTLRYWERIGLLRPVQREESSGHRRYSPEEVTLLETLANLRAVGLSIEDMRVYLAQHHRGDEAAAEQRALFQAHAQKLESELAALQLRQTYLALKVRYWDARERRDLAAAAEIAAELGPVIRAINPREKSS
ncbi:DNA-binding transcriptional MerR regulator [Jatrophihabitans sp. GAS493]|uniref:MerR family transcriptional regulator n=1 Tax=Jatrophihabitans sp. GAS493 TaxID=1907575 RepID=UPI000BB8CD0B|nr:MerR family transcriptional regulator [Jatrophihabitans sp. GAS493]SOD74850.1 DNA-binding transcriptional MerR regulator [Jatrophihabitans sp. GAS493]